MYDFPSQIENCHHSSRIKLGIFHFCRWLQHNIWQCNENVIIFDVLIVIKHSKLLKLYFVVIMLLAILSSGVS